MLHFYKYQMKNVTIKLPCFRFVIKMALGRSQCVYAASIFLTYKTELPDWIWTGTWKYCIIFIKCTRGTFNSLNFSTSVLFRSYLQNGSCFAVMHLPGRYLYSAVSGTIYFKSRVSSGTIRCFERLSRPSP